MTTAGGCWTAIQRRNNYYTEQKDFYRDWNEYARGFGDLKKVFWLGNDVIYELTNQGPTELRFELSTWTRGSYVAEYQDFRVAHQQEDFRVSIGADAGDASDAFWINNNMKFSTEDEDFDLVGNFECAEAHKGGWRYNGCSYCNPNGIHFDEPVENQAGITWYDLPGLLGFDDTLKKMEMKIRPIV